MKLFQRTVQAIGIVLLVGAISWAGYKGLVAPYVVLPVEDLEFLSGSPTRPAVMDRFGNPTETVGEGASFPMTGWRPLPERKAPGRSHSFVRRYGSKIYVFFDERGRLVEYFVATS